MGNSTCAESVVPGRDYIEMTFVKDSATGKGLNERLSMENLNDGTFKVTKGRIGIRVGKDKPRSMILPIADWDRFYLQKVRQGYRFPRTKKTEEKTIRRSKFGEIPDKAVKELVDRLISFADFAMQQNYTVRVEEISEEMISYGRSVLNELQAGYEDMSVAVFNNKLKLLYAAVPRRIDNLSKKLAKMKSDFIRIITDEQELFDLMMNQVRNANDAGDSRTILEHFGLTITPVTPEEEEEVKTLLRGQKDTYVNAWKVSLKKSEDAFDEFCSRESLTEGNDGVTKLFHGSKHENWWSILTNGIWCEPERHPEFCGTITGKAYGLGAYFAPDAIKSKGYTSFRGSKWAHGTENTGFMAVFKVATGDEERRYHGENGHSTKLNWANLQKEKKGALCTWAERRYSGFMMDEVIAYQECQFTINYLVELGE